MSDKRQSKKNKNANNNRHCPFYAKGACRHGDRCKMIHDPRRQKKSQAQSDNANSQKKHCRFYAQGRCRSGDKCKMLHDPSRLLQNQNGTGANNQPDKLCPFFARGNCRNGSKCKMLHDPNQVQKRNSKQRDTDVNQGVDDSTQTHCRFYARGHCRHGVDCRNLHDPSRQQIDLNAGLDMTTPVQPPRTQRNTSRRDNLCRFKLEKGVCPYGMNCKYNHDFSKLWECICLIEESNVHNFSKSDCNAIHLIADELEVYWRVETEEGWVDYPKSVNDALNSVGHFDWSHEDPKQEDVKHEYTITRSSQKNKKYGTERKVESYTASQRRVRFLFETPIQCNGFQKRYGNIVKEIREYEHESRGEEVKLPKMKKKCRNNPCTRPKCKYAHDPGQQQQRNTRPNRSQGDPSSDVCRFGMDCDRPSCTRKHPRNFICFAPEPGRFLYPIDPNTALYNEIADKFIAGTNMEYPIVSVERVVYMVNTNQYYSKKKNLAKKLKDRPQHDIRLDDIEVWHGTRAESVNSIIQNGFNRDFSGDASGRSVWGKGTYFHTSPSYPTKYGYCPPDANGLKRVFLCHMTMGEFRVGDSNFNRPQPKGDGQFYDTYLCSDGYDQLKAGGGPKIVVACQDAQAKPMYLITFRTGV